LRATGATIELESKAVSDDGTLEGYAATCGNTELGRDTIEPGAFAASITKRGPRKKQMLRGQDTTPPTGIWLDAADDRKCAHAQGRIIRETALGAETYHLMKAGALDALSIGYRAIKEKFDRVKGIRSLLEVDLFEISVVTFGMNPKATI